MTTVALEPEHAIIGAPPPRSAVFLNRFYWPDVTATAQMLTDLAEDLAAAGWTVRVITSDASYSGRHTKLPARERRNGVDIVRVRGTHFGRGTLLGRVLDYASYFLGAALELLRGPKHDMIVAMSDPPFLCGLALFAARLRGSATVYWVQDLYPQLAGRLGILSPSGALYRLLSRLARGINARCDLVIALGPKMAESLRAAGAHDDRVAVVHNWADAAALRPVPREKNPFVQAHGLEHSFVVLYSGNAGRAHTFDAVLDAMVRLRDRADIVFVFVGAGVKLGDLRRRVADAGLSNAKFLDYVPRDQLAAVLSAADLSLVTELPEAAGLLVPSKTYGILASGRPLLFVGSEESDVAQIVRSTGAGVIVFPSDGHHLADEIQRLRGSATARQRMSEDARCAAESLYDRPIGTRRWANVAANVTRVAAKRPSVNYIGGP